MNINFLEVKENKSFLWFFEKMLWTENVLDFRGIHVTATELSSKCTLPFYGKALRYCCSSWNDIFGWKGTWNYTYSPFKAGYFREKLSAGCYRFISDDIPSSWILSRIKRYPRDVIDLYLMIYHAFLDIVQDIPCSWILSRIIYHVPGYCPG